MSDFGVTAAGFNRKRLDVILSEMQQILKESIGIDAATNPKSYLNVLLTDIADKIAELWEVGEQTYLSMYPASAEGQSLDNAVSFGGVLREDDTRSVYPLDCKGLGGTLLPAGQVRVASDTNPPVALRCYGGGEISLAACNSFALRINRQPIISRGKLTRRFFLTPNALNHSPTRVRHAQGGHACARGMAQWYDKTAPKYSRHAIDAMLGVSTKATRTAAQSVSIAKSPARRAR